MEYFGLTDKGRVRPTNQDIYQIEVREEQQTALLVVCDGMGGANAGNVASRFAAQRFVDYLRPSLDKVLSDERRQALLQYALDEANATVFSLAGRQPEFRGMGTTLVAALVQGSEVTVLNVGDSRAYLYDGTRLHQLTEDHSYVEEMRRQGRISEADARTHPQKNLITRAVGVEPGVEGDLFEARLDEGEILLLCTDGLTGMVEDETIAQTLHSAQSLALAGDALLARALDGGGRDNITVALFTRGTRVEEEA
ncbi:MAG: Stp1/IreP family PP2C-type Ser/Thr phosphatase [Eubacteriales bacterium]|nr:Stp1/IreP family PP2C-type Ser/Thr phosphatase [Eubacteriales bacterium]